MSIEFELESVGCESLYKIYIAIRSILDLKNN